MRKQKIVTPLKRIYSNLFLRPFPHRLWSQAVKDLQQARNSEINGGKISLSAIL